MALTATRGLDTRGLDTLHSRSCCPATWWPSVRAPVPHAPVPDIHALCARSWPTTSPRLRSRCSAAPAAPSTLSSTRCGHTRGRTPRPRPCARCCGRMRRVISPSHTATRARCRTRTRCGACRRCTAWCTIQSASCAVRLALAGPLPGGSQQAPTRVQASTAGFVQSCQQVGVCFFIEPCAEQFLKSPARLQSPGAEVQLVGALCCV